MAPPPSGADREWEPYKAEMKSLFLTQGMTRKQVMTYMKEKHGFDKTLVPSYLPVSTPPVANGSDASIAQYNGQFGKDKWCFLKNSKEEHWGFVDRRLRKRKLAGLESEVYIHGKLVPEKKLRKDIARHVPLTATYAQAHVDGELFFPWDMGNNR